MRLNFSVFWSIAFVSVFGQAFCENATPKTESTSYASEAIVLESDPAGQLVALNDSDIVKALANTSVIGDRPLSILDFLGFEQTSSDPAGEKKGKWIQQIAYIVRSAVTGKKSVDVNHERQSLDPEPKPKIETRDVNEQGDDFENLSWVSQVVTKSFWKFYPKSNTNDLCSTQGNLYRTNFKNLTHWAVKMFDSMSVAPSGVIETDYFNSGHFDECININAKPHGIIGQYCLVSVSFRPYKELSPEFYIPDNKTNYNQPDPMKSVWLDIKPHTDPARKLRSNFELAVCVPKACSYKDVETSIQEAFDYVGPAHKLALKAVVRPVDCKVKDTPIKDVLGFSITVSIIGAACLLVGFGSIMDILVYKKRKSKSFFESYLKAFSAAKNMVKLKKPGSDEEFALINGIKAIAVIQVIVGHRIMFLFGNRVYNPSYIEEMVRWPPTAFINGGSGVAVDTFFGIGGFLTYLFIFRTLEQKKRINFPMILLYRWLRIVPLYALVIAMYTFIMPNLGNGPRWEYLMQRDTEGCRKNWWTNLIFLNNYINADRQCMVHSWYLAVDMQMFILTSLVAILIWKHQKYGWLIINSCIGISAILPVISTYYSRYYAVPMTFQSFLKDIMGSPEFYNAYIQTHNRAIPYVVGFAGAHLYLQLKEKNFKFTTTQMWIGTAVATFCGVSTVMYTALFYQAGREYYLWENAIFISVHRLLWVVIPIWIFIGHGTTGFGIADRFMSSPMMLVLGRLVYCIFLIHPLLQFALSYSIRTSYYISPFQLTWTICGDTLLSLFAGLGMNLLFESPFDRLQKKLLKSFIRDFKVKEKSPAEQRDNTELVENGRLPSNEP